MQVESAIERLLETSMDAELVVDTGDGIFKVEDINSDMEGNVIIYLGEMP